MSELYNNIETVSAVLDILQNNAHPSQKPVLRLVGDHLRLLARCMDDAALCPPHMPTGTPTPDTPRLAAYPPASDTSCRPDSSLRPGTSLRPDSLHGAITDGTPRRVQGVRYVRQ